jgi:FkbM family methyltransferase
MERDLIYDVGAHKGEDTDFYLKKGFRVVAIEALDELVNTCTTRFSDQLKEGKLTIIHAAIADEDGMQVPFYENTTKSVWGTLSLTWANSKTGTRYIEHSVFTRKLSSVMKEYGVPYYLKIDIEGMDMVALKSLEALESRPRYISIESAQSNFSAMHEQLNIFRKLGYSRFKYVDQATVPQQKPPQPAREGESVPYHFMSGSSGLFGNDLTGWWLPYPLVGIRILCIVLLTRLFGKAGLLNRGMIKKPLRRLGLYPHVGWYDLHGRR